MSEAQISPVSASKAWKPAVSPSSLTLQLRPGMVYLSSRQRCDDAAATLCLLGLSPSNHDWLRCPAPFFRGFQCLLLRPPAHHRHIRPTPSVCPSSQLGCTQGPVVGFFWPFCSMARCGRPWSLRSGLLTQEPC